MTLHDYAWKPGINPVVMWRYRLNEKFPGLFGTDPMYTEVIPSVWEVVYIQQLGQVYFIIAYGGSLYSYCGPTNLITTKDVPLLVQNK